MSARIGFKSMYAAYASNDSSSGIRTLCRNAHRPHEKAKADLFSDEVYDLRLIYGSVLRLMDRTLKHSFQFYLPMALSDSSSIVFASS